jgi:TonB family protein
VTEIPKAQPTPDEGAAGMAKGTGGGSKARQEKPGGGGGGGRLEDKPAVHGKLPQATLDPQVLAPDPKPPVIRNPSLPTAATIRADPALFPTDARALNYGDPKSKATELSSGSGSGNGIGEGTGGGVGAGSGTGYGPGEGYNTGGGAAKAGGGGAGGGGGGVDYARAFRVNEVSRRAQITSKPEPLYTEEARKNQVTGIVRLRLVLSATGQVTGVTPLTRLPDGLTEKAIEAARKINFTPAEKDGRKVSQYIVIEYNFNIY